MPVRRLAIVVLVTLGLLLVVDRVADAAAQRDVAVRIKAAENLSSQPDVDIHGFPFLTQMLGGQYDDVDVTVHGLHAGPLPITRLSAHLVGAKVPFSAVLKQNVGAVPTDRASGELLLSYADLNRFVSTDHVRFSAGDGGRLHVTATAGVAGVGVSAAVDVPVVVSGSALTVSAVGGIQVTIPLPGLPFHMRLNTAKATADGVVVAATVDDLVLRP
jgi:hypothetical protein